MRLGYLLGKRQIVRVAHPAVAVRVLDVAAGEVDGRPAADGFPHVLVHRDDDGEHDEDNDAVPVAQAVREVVILPDFGAGQAGEDAHNGVHGDAGGGSRRRRRRRSRPITAHGVPSPSS